MSSFRLPRRRRKAVASQLIKSHPLHRSASLRAPRPVDPVRVVCVSDTHNKRPQLPAGDILIHAGDLTENGSFDEFQNGLSWLSTQPHRHKILIAGNHDVILDDAFLTKYPARRYGDSRTKESLDWGSVTYLQDSSIAVSVGARNVSIFGSPWTPQYGVSAFQYPRNEDVWDCKFPKVDIVVTHGPPYLHLDQRDFHRAGCQYLAAEVARLRPKLVVFGHIHAAYGREDVVLDRARRLYGEIMGGWGEWGSTLLLALDVVMVKFLCAITGGDSWLRREKVTTFVNAAVVGGSSNELQKEAIVVEI